MDNKNLASIANNLVASSKGILAADESTGTIKKRLDSIKVESTEATRLAYRSMLFTTPGIEKVISGVILFDETIRQEIDGMSVADYLSKKGIIPGIKVDKGSKGLAGFADEKVTEGLDGLRERLGEYAKLGAKFTKWRAVITIGANTPTNASIEANAHALARYATLSQEAGLVPIVEPEVLMSGTHTIDKHAEVTQKTLENVFSQLKKYKIYLPGMLLKPNMIAAGLDSKDQTDTKVVAETTISLFKKTVPVEVPGIVFLSGGLTPEMATTYLNSMNKIGDLAWQLSFSFGRALQGEALIAWAGKKENVDKAQKAFSDRFEKVSKARSGEL